MRPAVCFGQVIAVVSVALLAHGCASGGGARSVPRSVAGQVQQVDTGTVVATREVVVDGESSRLGQAGGAIVGSAVGQTVGKGSGRTLAAAGGAVVGGIVGGMVEKELTKKRAQELTISVDDGSTIVVIQEIRDIGFIEGDRVKVTQTRMGEAIVSHSAYETDGIY